MSKRAHTTLDTHFSPLVNKKQNSKPYSSSTIMEKSNNPTEGQEKESLQEEPNTPPLTPPLSPVREENDDANRLPISSKTTLDFSSALAKQQDNPATEVVEGPHAEQHTKEKTEEKEKGNPSSIANNNNVESHNIVKKSKTLPSWSSWQVGEEEDSEEEGDTKPNNNNNNSGVDKSGSKIIQQHSLSETTVLQIRMGDITDEYVDAIVNAANSGLAHGGGVAGAISHRGGSQIQKESYKWVREHGSVDTGNVALTGPGKLPCKHVIHAVGPIWHNGKKEPKQLYDAVWNSLAKAHGLKLTTISVPAISSGIFGFPKDLCAEIMIACAIKFVQEHPDTTLTQIRYTNFDRQTVSIFDAEFKRVFLTKKEGDTTTNNNNSVGDIKSDKKDKGDEKSETTPVLSKGEEASSEQKPEEKESDQKEPSAKESENSVESEK